MAIPGFGQIQDVYKMQREAKKMEKKMRQVIVKGFSKDQKVSITIDGTQEIIACKINEDLLHADKKKQVEDSVKEAHKEATKKLQKEMTKDMDLGQLKSLLGG